MVKSEGGQWESDGVVVPWIAGRNPVGGKGPDFDRVFGVGNRQGMTGVSRSNNSGRQFRPAAAVVPVGLPAPESDAAEGSVVAGRVLVVPRVGSAGELQRALWAAAKQSPGRRFHALFDRVHRGDVLVAAWERVRANRGAAGVDKVTLAHVEEYGVARMLGDLQHDLRKGSYRPAPARRVDIPKPGGGKRPLGIPTVRDRVAQAAVKLVLEPIFEADFFAGLVRVPAQAVGDAGDGTASGRVHRGLYPAWIFHGCDRGGLSVAERGF
jgi:RNA-directed DNA polymerase